MINYDVFHSKICWNKFIQNIISHSDATPLFNFLHQAIFTLTKSVCSKVKHLISPSPKHMLGG